MRFSLWRVKKGRKRKISLKKLANTIKKKLLEEDRDFPIMIVGPEGEGKSNAAQVLAKMIDANYAVERNTFFAPTAEQANKFFINEAKGSVPIFDEFGDVGYKLDFAVNINKFLKKMFMKNRQSNMAPIFCIPNFLDVDKYYRWRVRLLIFVYKRYKHSARFVAFRPIKLNPFSGDVWQIKYNQKIWDEIIKGRQIKNTKTFLRAVRRWSIYWGEGSFPRMSKRDEDIYKKLKTEYFQSTNDEAETLKIKESRKTIILKKIISGLRELGASLDDLQGITGFNRNTIIQYCRVQTPVDFRHILKNIVNSCFPSEWKKSSYLHNKHYDNSKRKDKTVRLVTPENLKELEKEKAIEAQLAPVTNPNLNEKGMVILSKGGDANE